MYHEILMTSRTSLIYNVHYVHEPFHLHGSWIDHFINLFHLQSTLCLWAVIFARFIHWSFYEPFHLQGTLCLWAFIFASLTHWLFYEPFDLQSTYTHVIMNLSICKVHYVYEPLYLQGSWIDHVMNISICKVHCPQGPDHCPRDHSATWWPSQGPAQSRTSLAS